MHISIKMFQKTFSRYKKELICKCIFWFWNSGITTENEQSSLHLSAIFDEDNTTGQSSISSSSSRTTKYANHIESETKSRIQLLNHIFNELKSYFEDHFSQLVVLRPPNSVHISTSCHHCSITEYEKILLLLLGASIQGSQKQDTIRKIKGFPKEIQEELIEVIKQVCSFGIYFVAFLHLNPIWNLK